ncbi:hypothetical protein ACFL0S_10465 [Thermodesulfobacteriota bacterium]
MKTPYFEKLLYLDRDFISSKYELDEGVSPNTVISRTEGLKAGANVYLFSGGVSSSESKNYTTSTINMLQRLENSLMKYPEFRIDDFKLGSPSQICWVTGNLTIDHVKRTRSSGGQEEILGEESFFSLYCDEENGEPKLKFALVPTEEYWVSGLSSFQGLIKNVIGPIALPVKALLRVYAAYTAAKQWMAVPLVMMENKAN